MLAWVLAAMAVIAALSTAVLFRPTPAQAPAVVIRFFIYPPEKTTFGGPFAVALRRWPKLLHFASLAPS